MTNSIDPREHALKDPPGFLLESIGFIYDHPQMYVQRLDELHAMLYIAHYFWAYIAGERHYPVHLSSDEEEQIRRLIREDHSEKNKASDFQPIVDYWRKIDAILGVDPQQNICSNSD